MIVDEGKKLDATDKVYKFNDTVKFKVQYPKDFKKTKHHKDGEVIELHTLQATDWAERGLGAIVK